MGDPRGRLTVALHARRLPLSLCTFSCGKKVRKPLVSSPLAVSSVEAAALEVPLSVGAGTPAIYSPRMACISHTARKAMNAYLGESKSRNRNYSMTINPCGSKLPRPCPNEPRMSPFCSAQQGPIRGGQPPEVPLSCRVLLALHVLDLMGVPGGRPRVRHVRTRCRSDFVLFPRGETVPKTQPTAHCAASSVEAAAAVRSTNRTPQGSTICSAVLCCIFVWGFKNLNFMNFQDFHLLSSLRSTVRCFTRWNNKSCFFRNFLGDHLLPDTSSLQWSLSPTNRAT